MDEKFEQTTVAQFYRGRYRKSHLVDLAEDKCGQYLHMEDPVVLAALAAFCSGNRHRVFLRGSCQDYPESLPSLFRDNGSFCGNPKERLAAYRHALRRIRERFRGTRWDRENLGAVLQHYGVKTPWLDVVRSLHTAIWFATHTLNEDDPAHRPVERNTMEYGWISLYVDSRAGQRQLTVVDLWDAHSSQHVRPHAQQGLSLAMRSDPTDTQAHCPVAASESDFNTHRVARIRLPAQSERWRLCGHMFSSRFLFPTFEHDDTLRKLRRSAVREILEEACMTHGLDAGTLGTIYTVGAAGPPAPCQTRGAAPAVSRRA